MIGSLWFGACSCGRTKDPAKDKFVGEHFGELKLYNCPCGSTYSIPIVKAPKVEKDTETGICRHCRDHAGFEEVDGEMLSECCGATFYRFDEYEFNEDR